MAVAVNECASGSDIVYSVATATGPFYAACIIIPLSATAA
jgi:hypothetical protein